MSARGDTARAPLSLRGQWDGAQSMTEPVRVAYRALEKKGGSGVERGDAHLLLNPSLGQMPESMLRELLFTTLVAPKRGRSGVAAPIELPQHFAVFQSVLKALPRYFLSASPFVMISEQPYSIRAETMSSNTVYSPQRGARTAYGGYVSRGNISLDIFL